MTDNLNGTFYDAQDVQGSKYTPVSFNSYDSQGKAFQFFLTDYVLNTSFESGFLTGNTLDLSALLHKYTGKDITTDYIGLVIPEILSKYGAGKPVSISGAYYQKESVAQFAANGATLDTSLLVTMSVDGEVAVKASFLDAQGLSNIHSQAGKVFGNIGFNLGTIGNFQTSLGISQAQFTNELNTFVTTTVN